MEARIRQRFQPAILEQAIQPYGIEPSRLRLLDGFESFIYEFDRDGQAYILRIGHSLHRSADHVHGEVDWINYLALSGAPVARAIPSENGQMVEVILDDQGGQFLATAFVKAPGQPPRRAMFSPALYETYGRLIGSLHSRTQSYQPANPAWKRPAWDDAEMEFVDQFLPASQVAVRQVHRELCAYLHSLPTGERVYGLIHQDAHTGNLFVDEAGRLTLFDFDDCLYSWFVNDIAIVLFYIVMSAEDVPGFTHQFLTAFWRGYRQVSDLDPSWLKQIPYFMKLREMELYAVIHRDFDVDHLEDPWCSRYMHGRQEKIERLIPYINFDFEKFAREIE
jgi:amicoumacin kinase